MYALKLKNKMRFLFVAQTLEEYERQLKKAYWNWHGMQYKASQPTLDKFKSEYEAVTLTIGSFPDAPTGESASAPGEDGPSSG
jgi:hypothetical protein